MKTAKEILEESLSYMNCEGIIGENTRLERVVLYAMEEYRSQLWTSPCDCNPDEKTGETLCCNHCGKPTTMTESKELPGDEVKRIANNFFQWTENLDKDDDDYVDLLYCNSRNLRLQDQINSYIASRDARIKELEDLLSIQDFEEDDSHLYDDENDHFVQCDDCKQPDACRDLGCWKDGLTPPKN